MKGESVPTILEQIAALRATIADQRDLLALGERMGIALTADFVAERARRIARLEATVRILERLRAPAPAKGAAA